MNEIEMREAFEQMLGNIDVRIFLKASPLESGERSKLDKVLSLDMYYKSLYANSKNADKLISVIRDKIEAEDTHNFILSGYKGCGKSTFVGYLLRNLDVRNLVIRFDDHWEPREGITQNIIMFLYDKIFHDILPQNGGEPCKISKKYIEIFHDKMNGDFIESKIDLHDFFTFFTHKLMYAVRVRQEDNINEEKVKLILRDHVKEHIKSGSISSLMMLIVFWDIADRIVNNSNQKCCIVFESLDVIHNTNDVPKLVENVVAFRNNIDKITESIFYEGKPISDPTQDYMLVFVMRETTNAEFSRSINHFSDKKIRFHHFMMISETYDLYEIISKRYEYLESIQKQYLDSPKFCEMLHAIRNIKTILSNSTVRKRIFAIFNNDYRTCIEALERFGFSTPKVLDAYKSLAQVSSDENWPTFGYRSIIFRQIFNMLVKDANFNMIRKFDYVTSTAKSENRSIDLCRMILLYLNNCENSFKSEELCEKEYVRLNVLYLELLKFCKRPETIVQAIWNMYDLQNAIMWNHLVTFDDMHTITLDELQKEMDAVVQKEEDAHYAKVKITLAGQVYLNYILPHFEYFAASSKSGKGYSLFCASPEELCDIHAVEKVIKQERKEVVDSCKQMYLFFADVLDYIDEFNGKNFLCSKFATVKRSENSKIISRKYHCEKVIYSNIGYLDSLRFFIFYLMDDIGNKGGFKEDIDITDFIGRIALFNKEYKDILPIEFFDGTNTHIVLKHKDTSTDEQIVELSKKNGETSKYTVSLHTILKIIKICYNKCIVDSILEFMKSFGFHNGSQCTKYSPGTVNICKAFDACIDYRIISTRYEDFYTHITYKDGEIIRAEVNRKKRQEQQEQRRRKSFERKSQMTI